MFDITHKCNEDDETTTEFEQLEAVDHSHTLLACFSCGESLAVKPGPPVPRRVSPSGTSLETGSDEADGTEHESVKGPQSMGLVLPAGKQLILPGAGVHNVPVGSGLAGQLPTSQHKPRGGGLN